MSSIIHAEPGPIIMGRMHRGEDLLDTLTSIVRENRVILGRIQALGAVERATLAYYDQIRWTYHPIAFEGRYEITQLIGNVSMRDGQPMVHAHVTLADEKGKAFGGHLLSGTPVFACEFWIQPFSGPELDRGYDEQTGLPLWRIESGGSR